MSATKKSASQPAQFFSLAGRYHIDSDCTLVELRDDFRCLFDAGVHALEGDGTDLSGTQWAGVYALRQAYAIFQELDRRLAPAINRGGCDH